MRPTLYLLKKSTFLGHTFFDTHVRIDRKQRKKTSMGLFPPPPPPPPPPTAYIHGHVATLFLIIIYPAESRLPGPPTRFGAFH